MRTLLLLPVLAVAVCACGERPPPPPPDPPRVTLSPSGSSVADTKLTVTLNVSGCDELMGLELYDADKLVFRPTFAGNPTVVDLPREVFSNSYAKGLAASLSLTARVICADGRENRSTPASVRFFPVEEVVRAATGTQVVTDVFFAEGQGANTGFVGCSGNGDGSTSWVRVDRAGGLVATDKPLPFRCSINTWITERNLATGKRWAIEPGVGAFAFDGQLKVSAVTTAKVTWLAVGPDGDAVIFDATSGAETLMRISHESGAPKWAQPAGTAGAVIGTPLVHPTQGVYVPEFVDQFGQYKGHTAVEKFDYGTGGVIGLRKMKEFNYGIGDPTPRPPAALSVDGSILYFPFQTQPGLSTVVACGSSADGCTGADLKWQSAALTGSVMTTVAFNQHSMLAAVAPQFTWFLDAATGAVLNRDLKPISPEGALVTLGVQPGTGAEFYLLNGSGVPGSLPVELVAVDAPSLGELFRFSQLGSSIMAGVDEGGGLWLRVGPDLVRPMRTIEYQQVRHR